MAKIVSLSKYRQDKELKKKLQKRVKNKRFKEYHSLFGTVTWIQYAFKEVLNEIKEEEKEQ